MKKIILISIICVVLLVSSFIFFYTTEKPKTSSKPIRVVPLEISEKNKVIEAVEKNSLVEDIPSSGIIAIRFYSFQGEERIWRDEFLISKQGIVREGDPDLNVYLHAKYIEELTPENLCEILGKANSEGDMSIQTNKNKILLAAKFTGLLKHRDCLAA